MVLVGRTLRRRLAGRKLAGRIVRPFRRLRNSEMAELLKATLLCFIIIYYLCQFKYATLEERASPLPHEGAKLQQARARAEKVHAVAHDGEEEVG